MILLSSLPWTLIWGQPAERISLQAWSKYLCKVWERAPYICPWDQAKMVKMYFCFCQVTYRPLAKMKLDKSSQGAKTKMFIEVQKPSCIILLLNARCPSGLSHHRLTVCRAYLYTFPGFDLWGGISHCLLPNETGLFVPVFCALETAWKQNTENRQSLTTGCNRSHLKPIFSGDELPE